jgi:hypothetical protein
MSYNGKFTPLQLNALSGLLNSVGLCINPLVRSLQGTYDPTVSPRYVQGTVTSTTVLHDLTAALPLVKGIVQYTTFRGLINIGTGTIPALGNRRPETFARTYPGEHDPYPPQEPANLKYPQYPSPYVSPHSPIAAMDNYAWLTGWTKDEYTYATLFNPSAYSDADEYFKYGYIACHAREAYYEFWNLKDEAKPNHYIRLCRSISQHKGWRDVTNQTIASFKNTKGFLDNAYSNINDLTTADIAGLSLSFRLFGNDLIALGNTVNLADIEFFGQADKFLLQLQSVNAVTNALKLAMLSQGLSTDEINAILNAKIPATFTQMKKIYDAMLLIQGPDLDEIKVITNCQTRNLTSLADLLNIQKMFPNSYRSLTVPRYSLDTIAVKIYDFLYVDGGVNSRIQNHSEYLGNTVPPEIAIPAAAFSYAMQQVKYIKQMNFQKFAQAVAQLEVTNKELPLVNNNEGVPGSRVAADEALYLTALGSGNSGTYTMVDFMGNISGDQYNPIYLGIIPLIRSLQTQLLFYIYHCIYAMAQSIVTYGLNLTRTTRNDPPFPDPPYPPQSGTSIIMADTSGVACGQFAYGSGIGSGTIIMSVSGSTVVFNQSVGPLPSSTPIEFRNEEGLIQKTAEANDEIARIATYGGATMDRLNYLWDVLGRMLSLQQRAIPFSAPTPQQISQGTNRVDLYEFVRQLEIWANDTQYKEIARSIENISDLTTLAGQSIVALMREARNATRVGTAGGVFDNDVNDSIKTMAASARATVTNGKVTSVELLNGGSGYDPENPPQIYVNGVIPPSGIAPVLEPVLSQVGQRPTSAALGNALMNPGASIVDINIKHPGANLPNTNPDGEGGIDLVIQDPPAPSRKGYPLTPGVIPNYDVINTIPPELVSEPTSSYTEDEAIEDVTICNCECWIV